MQLKRQIVAFCLSWDAIACCMQLKITWKLVFAFWCSIACLLGCAVQRSMPVENQVLLSDAADKAQPFTFSQIQAQQLNGKLNLAVTSKEGQLLQINGLDAQKLKSGKQTAGSYNLVLLPGGMQPACTIDAGKSPKLLLIEGENQAWGLFLKADLSCQGKKIQVDARLTFRMPNPEYAAPISTQ